MYNALVSKIHTRPHPNADRLQIGTCGAYQVIVGKDAQDGELGLFFEQGGQLSEEFAKANDLIRRKDENGNPAGGMFEPNRRVKAITLRGVRSEGFWCPLSMLDAVKGPGPSAQTPREGDELDSWNGVKICQRYETPATRSGFANRAKKIQPDNPMFAKHIDTRQLRRARHEIPASATCYISEKLHGTSFRFGRVLVDVPINRWFFGRVLAKVFGWKATRKDWGYLNGSRNVVLENNDGRDGFYESSDFRFNSTKGISLHKEEVLYGELVGYTTTGSPIMGTHDTSKMPEVLKKYGPSIVYSYGCEVGQCKAFIYRITQVNEDGVVTELSWNQVKRRCQQLGLETVPVLWIGPESNLDSAVSVFCTDKPSVLDSRHIMEGIVVRHESEHGINWLKQKTYEFSVLEGIIKDNDNYIDMEEAT